MATWKLCASWWHICAAALHDGIASDFGANRVDYLPSIFWYCL